jgi:hypothetical protein
MNQEREERTIRELFRQLKRDEEPSAPPFAATREAALSRSERRIRFPFARLAAAAIVVLLLLGGVRLIFTTRSARPPSPIALVDSGTPAGRPTPKFDLSTVPRPAPASIARQAMKPKSDRRKPAPPRPETLLVSEWRSPTVSLLRMPGEQVLKTVPRLDESLIGTRPLAPVRQREQQN